VQDFLTWVHSFPCSLWIELVHFNGLANDHGQKCLWICPDMTWLMDPALRSLSWEQVQGEAEPRVRILGAETVLACSLRLSQDDPSRSSRTKAEMNGKMCRVT
jgi:hypothetical protein